ncbi:hypothetical protein G443_001444 [Actinoalloteichus cyanogriseus DSM 43889]|uniref:Uncharacterized protein n=1 Tax=Actinoalloteichus caeruleus DSM 43889 TaxID=1120930 RepID=A0ABT1JFW2_ACTCY|nr:hypothetical protein [Actinoalloteichus caeruleus]MCP2331174.1 hypothetical protein [Actinoalloteichus caeruleus DSM 43889]
MSGNADWNVGVNAADADCNTAISTYTCQTSVTNGNATTTAARTRSSPTSIARRGTRSA